MSELLKCKKCGAEHPTTTKYFAADRRIERGVRALCLACNRKRNTKYNTEYQKNRAAIRAAMRQQREQLKAAKDAADFGGLPDTGDGYAALHRRARAMQAQGLEVNVETLSRALQVPPRRAREILQGLGQ